MDNLSSLKYSSLYSGDSFPMGAIAEALTGGKVSADSFAHADPDIDPAALSDRAANWHGTLGQCGASQSHLANQNVGVGDLFLFYGLFRQTEGDARNLRFTKGAPEIHTFWGWLQIGKVVPVMEDTAKEYPEFARHPHVYHPDRPQPNVLYVAKETLEIPSLKISLPGCGIFQKFDLKLQLTAEGENASIWCLPKWFEEKRLTYHSDDRWSPCEKDPNKAVLKSISPGQEFVCDLGNATAAVEWLDDIFGCAKS